MVSNHPSLVLRVAVAQSRKPHGGCGRIQTFSLAVVNDWAWVHERGSIFNRQAGRHPPGDHCGHWRKIMEMSETESIATKRQAWNAGSSVGGKRALKPKQIWEIRFYLNERRRLRDRALLT
jgi:hypothetical protein